MKTESQKFVVRLENHLYGFKKADVFAIQIARPLPPLSSLLARGRGKQVFSGADSSGGVSHFPAGHHL